MTPDRIEAFIFAYAPLIEHLSNVPEVYVNPFDRDDSHYINLTLATDAKLITSRDKDLLCLMDHAEGEDFRIRFPE